MSLGGDSGYRTMKQSKFLEQQDLVRCEWRNSMEVVEKNFGAGVDL